MPSERFLESLLTANYLQLAMPVFFVLIGIEVYQSAKTRVGEYRLNDSLTNIATGILSEVMALSSIVFTSAAYIFLYDSWHYFDIAALPLKAKLAAWCILVIAQDFFYYWYHRGSHRLNIGWGGHITHHQSEDYNLSVALRQSSLYPFFAAQFYLPLALIGFPPSWFASVYGLNLVYQFWIHTEKIKTLGWFERVFNAPSHHRVHHATNQAYLDKNYGGLFIVWDKIFGTFATEDEPPRYGITTQLRSWNPVWAVVHYYAFLLKASARAPNVGAAVQLWLMPPDWNPEWLARCRDDYTGNDSKYNSTVNGRSKWYLLAQFTILLSASVLYLFRYPEISRLQALSFVAVTTWGFMAIGAQLDRKAWGYQLELLRLPIFYLGLPATLYSDLPPMQGIVPEIGLTIAMMSWFQWAKPKAPG